MAIAYQFTKMDTEEKERRAGIVIESCAGIIPYCEAFYLHSIIYSAVRCLESFQQYDYMKSQDVNPDYLISIVQEAVGHAAALSRYFWVSPQGKKSEPHQKNLRKLRGQKLREAFGLEDTSPLHNRDLRNAWEHFDERLDIYLLENDAGDFYPNCIIDSHKLADEPVLHIFKLLDTQAECLVLIGTKYFFAPIRNEVEKIYQKAQEFNKKGSRI